MLSRRSARHLFHAPRPPLPRLPKISTTTSLTTPLVKKTTSKLEKRRKAPWDGNGCVDASFPALPSFLLLLRFGYLNGNRIIAIATAGAVRFKTKQSTSENGFFSVVYHF